MEIRSKTKIRSSIGERSIVGEPIRQIDSIESDVNFTVRPIQQCRSLDGWQITQVRSSSEPYKRYTVFMNPWQDAATNICECKGYRYNGQCRHQHEASAKICGWRETPTSGKQQTNREREENICPECGESTQWVMEVIEKELE